MSDLDGESRRSDLQRPAESDRCSEKQQIPETHQNGKPGTRQHIFTDQDKSITIKVGVENEYQDTGTGAKALLDQNRPCNAAWVSQLPMV